MTLQVVAQNRTVGVEGRLVSPPDSSAVVLDVAPLTVWPGLVDIHAHGGGGHAFTTTDPDEARAAAWYHATRGTTRVMASLVSAPPDVLASQVSALAPLVEEGVVLGVHLEGPWISHARCGAHAPEALRLPDVNEVRDLLDLGRGAVRMVTIAPELPGAIDVIELLVAQGVVAAIGHTDASARDVAVAVDAGATVATHLWNAMPPLAHRAPGPILELLRDPAVIVELIADGEHVDADLVSATLEWVGVSRGALVSDAMSAAGLGAGRYVLGSLEVDVLDGVARIAGTTTLAGSTITLVDAVARVGSEVGLARAVHAATVVPCSALRLPAPDLSVGEAADLILIDADGGLAGVMRAGEWITTPSG